MTMILIDPMTKKTNTMNIPTSLSLRPQKENPPFFLRTEIDRLLAISMLFSGLLLAVRMVHTGRNTFLFLVWNLFLAYLPYVISGYLTRRLAAGEARRLSAADARNPAGSGSLRPWFSGRLYFAALCLAWLLCIPNSFYLITDLFHLGDTYNDRMIPPWYDLVMILSFVWNGLLLGVLSVRQMERLLRPHLPAHNELLFLYPLFWLNALGVYIGRYLRFNSWDLITDPFFLLRDIGRILLHPLRNQPAWGMIFCFSILMTLIYLMLKKLSKALD
jgi:uncharacterized membrane protein